MDIKIDGYKDRWIERQMDRKIDGQKDRQIETRILAGQKQHIADSSMDRQMARQLDISVLQHNRND